MCRRMLEVRRGIRTTRMLRCVYAVIGSGSLVEVVFQVQVGEQELVGERLRELGEQPAPPASPRGALVGKRVGEDVERIDAVPTSIVTF